MYVRVLTVRLLPRADAARFDGPHAAEGVVGPRSILVDESVAFSRNFRR